MKQRRLILLAVALPLLFSCGGKDNIINIPPPPTPVKPNPGGNPGQGGGDKPTGPWEANRGKVVTPSGTGWTKKTVREGITYYAFSGKDPVTGVSQNVCAIDLDLTNDSYAVQLTYSAPATFTSNVHAKYNAIATMNAGYEAGSIFIRVGGQNKSILPNLEIGDTKVSNWKSEAGIFCDGGRSISIQAAEQLIRPYVSPSSDKMSAFISAERSFYYGKDEPYVISSSPMLVKDYEPVGETFIDMSYPNWSKLNTEHPQYHQRKRHPRSAVGLTENKHFIMIVVDGRQSGTAEGMSAKELTQFFVKNFNPQYALNMDGGGSTAMCVEGLGKADTHVVNVPINDNKKGNERARDTHFIIIEK